MLKTFQTPKKKPTRRLFRMEKLLPTLKKKLTKKLWRERKKLRRFKQKKKKQKRKLEIREQVMMKGRKRRITLSKDIKKKKKTHSLRLCQNQTLLEGMSNLER